MVQLRFLRFLRFRVLRFRVLGFRLLLLRVLDVRIPFLQEEEEQGFIVRKQQQDDLVRWTIPTPTPGSTTCISPVSAERKVGLVSVRG